MPFEKRCKTSTSNELGRCAPLNHKQRLSTDDSCAADDAACGTCFPPGWEHQPRPLPVRLRAWSSARTPEGAASLLRPRRRLLEPRARWPAPCPYPDSTKGWSGRVAHEMHVLFQMIRQGGAPLWCSILQYFEGSTIDPRVIFRPDLRG